MTRTCATAIAVVLVVSCSNAPTDQIPQSPTSAAAPTLDGYQVPMQPPPPPDATEGLPAQPECAGDLVASEPQSAFSCGLLTTFYDPASDAVFLQEVQYQTEFWAGLPASVSVYNECDPSSKNAMSSPQGWIVFGYYMFWDVIEARQSYGPIAGILAHEWGHQAQYLLRAAYPTSRERELEADGFSGYYLVLSRAWDSAAIQAYFDTIYSLGEYQFDNPDHHGTPGERQTLGMYGAMLAEGVLSTGTNLGYEDLHQYLQQEVSSIQQGEPLYYEGAAISHIALTDWLVAHRKDNHFGPPTLSYDERRKLFPRPEVGHFIEREAPRSR